MNWCARAATFYLLTFTSAKKTRLSHALPFILNIKKLSATLTVLPREMTVLCKAQFSIP